MNPAYGKMNLNQQGKTFIILKKHFWSYTQDNLKTLESALMGKKQKLREAFEQLVH